MASNIPVIVQGNSFSLAIPLQIYYINGDQMDLQDYTPDPTDEVSVQLKGSRRNYTYTPTVDGNICNIDISGNELADNYSVVVSIVKANGQRLRSFRTDQFFIVESSDDLTPDDIIEGLEENVIYLNSSIFVAGEDGRGITSIVKTSTAGLVDTYTITYSDNTTSTFDVTNGAQGQDGQQGQDGVGITSIEKTSSVGLVDTYTITLSNGNTETFTVTNGKDGVDLGLATIINDLTTGGATDVLSAEMGKVLNDKSVGELTHNLFSLDGWQDKYYLPNATGSTNNNWDTTGYISIENGKTYSFRIGTKIPTSIYNYYTLWDANKSYLGTASYDTSTGTLTINNANAKYLRISIYGASYGQTDGTLIKRAHTKYFIMFNEGADILAYDVFGKVKIKNSVESDYLKDDILVDTRNMFDWDNMVTGNIVDGVYTSTGNNNVTPFIDVSNLGQVLLQWGKNGANNSNGVLFAYDENQNPLFTIPCPFNSTGGYLVPALAKYVRGYNITGNILTLSVGTVIPYRDYEPTAKINSNYIPFLSRLEGKKIAYLGDSFTSLNVYPTMVTTLLHCGESYNYGTSGYKYSALKTRLESYASNVPNLDAIVILGGANDFATSDGVSNFENVCRQLISYIYSLNPTILILHLTPTYTYGYTPPGGSTPRTDTDANGVHIRDYADAIRSACDKIGVPVLDTYRTLGITEYNVASMTTDGLHPTDAVFKKMGWQVAKKLSEL